MFFSEKKLRRLANISDKVKIENIIEAINSIGFEVEQYSPFNKVKGIKFGHVLKTYKNPNSSKLNVCEIQFNDKVRIIQTTAQNVKNNDYVIAFVPGAIIDGVKISAKEMGGIKSDGMLASYPELGFNESLLPKELEEGILILEKVDLSLDPVEFFDLDDNIIEVSILSNRSDAMSYEIFSKELAAYFQTKTNNNKTDQKIKKETFKSDFKIKQNDNLITGLEVKNKGEFKLSTKDKFLILKSNIKLELDDLENFASLILINTGVSIRCFDAEKINKNISIKVENNIHYLNDGKNNISILGVDVVDKHKANKNSKSILFEFSQINEKLVRDNSKLTKKITNSSINNSRTIPSGLIEITKNFITNYFNEFSQHINMTKLSENKIKFEKDYLNNYAGFDITKKPQYKNAIKSLETLGFKFGSYVSYPNTRHDIKNMQSIVEEVFRFYGLNNFELSQIDLKTSFVEPIDSIEKIISALGYKQAWTYTLINKDKNIFNPFEFSKTKKLKTFVSEEFNSIRNSIALPLLNVYEYNKKRKIEKMSLFDRGMINDKKAIMISSNIKSYADIKSDIEKITNQKFEVIKLEDDLLHPNYNAGLRLAGSLVGWIGKFNPYKIDSDVIFAEILEECIYRPANRFNSFDQSPLKERDITFEIEKDYENDLYMNILNSIDGVFSVTFVSKFKKDNIDKLTYKILLDEKALAKFDSIDWNNKKKLLDFDYEKKN